MSDQTATDTTATTGTSTHTDQPATDPLQVWRPGHPLEHVTTTTATSSNGQQARQGWVRGGGGFTGRKRIAIVGYTWHINQVPWNHPEWEIWGMNNLHHVVRPGNIDIPSLGEGVWSAWFDVHEPGHDAAQKEWLEAEHPFPRFVHYPDRYERGVEAIPYEMLAQWATERGLRADYVTNSVSWELVWACYQLDGVEGAELGVFGVDMAHQQEYSQQRPNCEYWLGIASGLGIKVTLPAESDLLAANELYGLEAEHPITKKQRQLLKEQQARIQQIRQDRLNMQVELEQVRVRHRAELEQREAQINLANQAEQKALGIIEITEYLLQTRTQPESRDRDAVKPTPGGVDYGR